MTPRPRGATIPLRSGEAVAAAMIDISIGDVVIIRIPVAGIAFLPAVPAGYDVTASLTNQDSVGVAATALGARGYRYVGVVETPAPLDAELCADLLVRRELLSQPWAEPLKQHASRILDPQFGPVRTTIGALIERHATAHR